MYPEVYDLQFRRLAILKDADDLHIEYELNTWPTLYFSLPINSPQWHYVQNEFYVKYDNELYVIKNSEASMSGEGGSVTTVECPATACELNTKMVQVLGSAAGENTAELFYESGTPRYITELVLKDTGWGIGIISGSLENKVRSFLIEWESVAANLTQIAEKYECYIRYRSADKLVDLLDEDDIGENNGVTIEYGKNMTQITRTVNTDQLITRLYVYGGVPPQLGSAGSLEMTINEVGVGIDDPDHPYYRPSIERINSDQGWVSCTSYIHNFQYFTSLGFSLEEIYADVEANGRASRFIKEGHFKDDDYIEPLALYDHAKKKLDQELSLPEFNYTVGLLDLSELSGWDLESFKIGDWVTVINRDLNIEVDARIVKFIDYPGFPEKTQVELSNTRDSIGDVLASTVKTAGGLKRSSSINQLKRNMLNTVSFLINSGYNAITLEDETDPNKLVKLTSGGIGVSSDGGNTYPYAVTGEGILGDQLVISDVHAVSTEDGHTQINSSGVTVYDNDDIARVKLGQYESGKFGLQIDGGALKVTAGGIRDSEIQSANKWNTMSAHTIILSNENQPIFTDSNGATKGPIVIESLIDTYKGSNRIAGTLGEVILKSSSGNYLSVQGVYITKSNPTASSSGQVTMTLDPGVNLPVDVGYLEIPITIESNNYIKRLSWSKAKEGEQGDPGYTPIKGVDYFDGIDGQDGKGIVSSTVSYQNHTNGTTPPTGTWTENPNPIKGQYLWTRTVTTYTEGDPVTTYSVAYQAIDGTDGRGIVSTVVEYVKSTTATMPSSGWSTTRPTVNKGEYLWTRTTINYTSGSPSVSISNSYVPTDGQNGSSAYLWVRYSQYPDGTGFTDDPTNALYIGVATTTTSSPPTNKSSYNWSLIKGQDGVPGEKGADGKSSYLHIKYSDDGGITFTANNGETVGAWIGTYVDFNPSDSNNPGDYTWNKVRGDDGLDAKYVLVSGEQLFKYPAGLATPTPTSITLTASLFGGLSGYNWEYWTGSAWASLPGTSTNQTYNLSYNNTAWGSKTALRVRCQSGGYYDEITIVKVYDGIDGSPGSAGSDALTAFLTNESHSVPTDSAGSNGDYTGSGTQVHLYEGTTPLQYDGSGTTNGTWKVTVSGSNITPGGLTDKGAYVTVGDHSNMSADTATVTYTITGKRLNGTAISLVKTQTLSKAKQGNPGASAKVASILATTQIFKSTDGGETFSPDTITLTPSLQNVTFSKWQHSTDGGSTWVDSPSGSNGITIAGGVLTLSKDSNLFTSDITSISFKLVTNDVNVYDVLTVARLYDVTEILIGARNLLLNTSFSLGTERWAGSAGSTLEAHNESPTGEFPRGAKYCLANTSTGTEGYSYQEVELELNTKYTVSTWLYAPVTYTGTLGISLWKDTGSGWAPISGSVTTSDRGKWVYIEATFTSDVAITKHIIGFGGTSRQVDDIVYQTLSKLEKGTIGTDWTPAPEDLTSEVDELGSRLTELRGTIETTFADSIISEAEAISLSTHINRLNTEFTDINNRYIYIYDNPNLQDDTIKTSLAEAKATYDLTHVNLINAIYNAIGDSNISEAERADIDTKYEAYIEALGDLATNFESAFYNIAENITRSAVDPINDRVNALEFNIGDMTTDIYTSFQFDETGLKIGKTDSPLNIAISNEQIDFVNSGAIVAYINGQKMYINSLEVLTSLVVGNHKIEKFNDEITLIKWVG